jgi:predicted site-specific integrase-resolvase
MTQAPVYVTTSQMIRELREYGVGPDAVRGWLRRGDIPSLKLPNGEYRIHRAVIEAIKHGEDPHEALRGVPRESVG